MHYFIGTRHVVSLWDVQPNAKGSNQRLQIKQALIIRMNPCGTNQRLCEKQECSFRISWGMV